GEQESLTHQLSNHLDRARTSPFPSMGGVHTRTILSRVVRTKSDETPTFARSSIHSTGYYHFTGKYFLGAYGPRALRYSGNNPISRCFATRTFGAICETGFAYQPDGLNRDDRIFGRYQFSI